MEKHPATAGLLFPLASAYSLSASTALLNFISAHLCARASRRERYSDTPYFALVNEIANSNPPR